MEVVSSHELLRLNKYIKTFNIKYSDIAKQLDLNSTTIPKYFNGKARMSITRYNEILNILRIFAEGDELKLHLIDTWLKVKSDEEKKSTLKRLCKEISVLSLELNEIVGE